MSGLWLPSRARSQVRTLLPAGVVAVSSSLALALWFVGGPTVAGVDASLERGDLVEARIEAEALTRLGRDPDGLDVALVRLDELEAERRRIREAQEHDEHLARLQDAPTLQAAVDELGRGWHTDRRIADARAVVSKCRRSGAFDCAVAALRGWERVAGDGDARRRYDEVRAAVVDDLGAAVAKADLEGRELERRVGSVRSALADAVLYESLVGEPGEPVRERP